MGLPRFTFPHTVSTTQQTLEPVTSGGRRTDTCRRRVHGSRGSSGPCEGVDPSRGWGRDATRGRGTRPGLEYGPLLGFVPVSTELTTTRGAVPSVSSSSTY